MRVHIFRRLVFIFIDEVYRGKKMPPVRCQNIGRRKLNASSVYNLRNNETEEGRRQRLEANKMQIFQTRSTTASEESISSTSGERQQNRL